MQGVNARRGMSKSDPANKQQNNSAGEAQLCKIFRIGCYIPSNSQDKQVCINWMLACQMHRLQIR